MKRTILPILFILLFFSACSDDEKKEVVMQQYVFNVTTESNSTDKDPRYILAVYDTDGNPQNVFSTSNRMEQTQGSFTVNLDVTKTYTCLFWADFGEIGSANNFYNASDLKAVTMNKTAKPTDAFSGIVTTSITKDKYDVKLSHAVARIDYVETDDVGAGKTLTVAYSVNYSSLNVLDGTAVFGSGKDERSFSLTETTGKLAADYIFAPKESARMDVTLQMGNTSSREIKNVPHQVNKRTKIQGEFLNTQATMEVAMDDKWNEVEGEGGKVTYFPKWVCKDLANWSGGSNDFQNPNSQFSIHRMMETPNLVAFWEPQFGSDPETCSNANYRFPLRDLMAEAEKMYRFFRDELKFAEKGNSLSDDYRLILFFYYSDEGTVYGGSADDKVGAMWITPNRVKNAPYGAIAHEMGHAFQEIVRFDKGRNFPGGSIFEMTSQYMLWQYYSNWIVFENYHLTDFMKKNHYAFLHETNMYHSPFVLEYWASLHGNDVIGNLWRSVQGQEDIVSTYKRYAGLTQTTFNDELHRGYLRFMTWDMDRIRTVSAPYINQHKTKLDALDEGWYQVAKENCPQNYGYNGIRLEVPEAGTKVTLDFKGVAGATGYSAYNLDKAGWRYGFMALTSTGERVYSETYAEKEGQATFTVPEKTTYLWVVVMGAPTSHATLNSSRVEEWPYQIKLTGTTIIQ